MKTVLCYGDSNTYGYNPLNGLRYPKDARWTGVLAKELGDDYTVVEEGCNGRTTIYDDPIDGWKNGIDYLKPCLNSHKPVDIFIIMLGSNDLKNVFGINKDNLSKGIDIIIDLVKGFTMEKQGFVPEIILVAPPKLGDDIESSPFSFSFNKTAVAVSEHFAAEYKKVADIYGCIFFDAAEHITASKEDSLHLMPEAHKILGEKLADIVRSL